MTLKEFLSQDLNEASTVGGSLVGYLSPIFFNPEVTKRVQKQTKKSGYKFSTGMNFPYDNSDRKYNRYYDNKGKAHRMGKKVAEAFDPLNHPEFVKIGITGNLDYEVNKEDINVIYQALKNIDEDFQGFKKSLISNGLNTGIFGTAYDIAKKIGWLTGAVTCSKINDMEKYEVDSNYIIGEEWGDEDDLFLSNIDGLYKFGSDEQSENKAKKAREMNIPVREI